MRCVEGEENVAEQWGQRYIAVHRSELRGIVSLCQNCWVAVQF